jgi:anti-sigma B factor antagonist
MIISTNLTIRGCDDHALVALRGELDLADATYMAAVLMAVVGREPEIVVDLTDLEFMDSNGLAALARGRRQARHAGGDLLLAAPARQALRLLTVTRLADNFRIYASAEEAAGSIGRPREADVLTLRRLPGKTR